MWSLAGAITKIHNNWQGYVTNPSFEDVKFVTFAKCVKSYSQRVGLDV